MSHEYRKVRVPDIPQEGLELVFELDARSLSDRVNAPFEEMSEQSVAAPHYRFLNDLPVQITLYSDGRSVEMRGKVKGTFNTICARCAGDASGSIDVPVFMILKPIDENGTRDGDDANYGYYTGDTLDCSVVIEELVVLALPYNVNCNESCLGLCFHCGLNRNINSCTCDVSLEKDTESETSFSPFAKLKDFKLQ
ncbi:MAG TPA: DUF177 domain-containing protein [Oligoflexia bacterium]|nr:DUF177 domain-containing protein [Oligoflexia bacterium]HMP47748.1 DUF177 domain-containing protein [Oligoflexia bacterium]